GEVVGVVGGDRDSDAASISSGLAVPGTWLLARSTPVGLTATVVDAPCLPDAERAAAAEAATAAAERRAAVETEQRQQAEAEAAAQTERRKHAEAAAERAQAEAVSASEARRQAEERLAEVLEEPAAECARFVRWSAWGAVGVLTIGLVLWMAGRRSVEKAKLGQVRVESLAKAAPEDLVEPDDRERLASTVPTVALNGTDADGRSIAVRIPGGAIAAAAGVVFGRNPFESDVLLDHTEVSRRHFRLCARETSVFIEDLQSTNGTMLDGVVLKPGAAGTMRHGAVLQVGGATFTVVLVPRRLGRAVDGSA
ncbi:MAG: FHA domain-containing protein, partial [Gammaproteobacteria bacterium]|nr:FHA domain-containing protein [Gammaproteobacteria bacterium]